VARSGVEAWVDVPVDDDKQVCVGCTVVVPTWASVVEEATWAEVSPGVDDREEDWDAGEVLAVK